MNDISQGVDRPYGGGDDTRQAAARYMILTRRAWALDMLGLSGVPLPEKYAAARDKLLRDEPAPAVQPGKPRAREPRRRPDRSKPNCMCAAAGLAYRLCPEHGEPGIAVAPQNAPESARTPSDRGGVIPVPGPRGTVTRVHVGPPPGVCSVDPDGCGYCVGVPCRSPRRQEENAPDGDK